MGWFSNIAREWRINSDRIRARHRMEEREHRKRSEFLARSHVARYDEGRWAVDCDGALDENGVCTVCGWSEARRSEISEAAYREREARSNPSPGPFPLG